MLNCIYTRKLRHNCEKSNLKFQVTVRKNLVLLGMMSVGKTTIGKIETAQGGTLFLDEIGDMPIGLQAKMLRFLQERVIERVGGRNEIPVDIRVICATHRDLQAMVAQETFREDLYYRVGEMPIVIPPLRERDQDIILLARTFLNIYREEFKAKAKSFSETAVNAMLAHKWPGNIRELANFVERMVVLSIGSTITPRDLPDKVLGEVPEEKWTPLEKDSEPTGNPTQILQQSLKQSFHVGIPDEGINLKKLVEGFEKELLIEALEKTGWVKNKAATLLSLNRTTLVEKLKKLKITNPPA